MAEDITDPGLAQQLVYGDGKGQNVKHFYSKRKLRKGKGEKCNKSLQKR